MFDRLRSQTEPGSMAGSRRSFTVMVGAILAAYLIFAGVLYLWRGVYFTPDLPDSWAVFLLLGAIVLGRWKAFLWDWLPLIALLFGYEMLRGFIGSSVVPGNLLAGQPDSVHVQGLMRADAWLFGGTTPTAWLQGKLYVPGVVHWYDLLASLIYSLHFALPLIFGFVLWIRSREQFRRFSITLLIMTYGTFVIYLLYPTAPPWLANAWGDLPGISDPFNNAMTTITPSRFSQFQTLTIFTKVSPDPVAAFPSLHAAYPWLIMLFLVKLFGKRGYLYLIYNIALWFSIIYLAQHWAVDALAGIIWATFCFFAVNACWDRWIGKGEVRSEMRERVVTGDEVAGNERSPDMRRAEAQRSQAEVPERH